jgi:hypothetical protein
MKILSKPKKLKANPTECPCTEEVEKRYGESPDYLPYVIGEE